MEFAVEFGGEPQDVTVTASGVADVAGLRELVRTLAADERYRPGLLLLYQFSELDLSQLSDDELAQVTDTIMERARRRSRRPGLRSPTSGDSRSGRQLFTSRDDAVAWLATMRA